MSSSESLELLKRASGEVPVGARERVWNRLRAPAPTWSAPLWMKGLAFAACTAAGFALVSSLTPSARPTLFSFEHALATSTGEVTRDAAGVLHLRAGKLLVSSWGPPAVKVVAENVNVEGETAVFSVEVAAHQVTTGIDEGEIHVNGERVWAEPKPAGAPAPSAELKALVALEPTHASEDRAWALAERDVDSGRYPEALQRFDALGGQGLRAEAALLKKGELQLQQLNSPAAALATFELARSRFPTGSLGQEVDLSSLEALLALERWTDARARATDFLSRFPDSERQVEVRYVSALAAWRLDDKATACREIRALQPSAFSGERRSILEKLTSQCTLFER